MRRTARLVVVVLALALASLAALAGEIQSAASVGDLEAVKALLVKDPSLLKSVDADGRTALHHAAFEGKAEVLAFLLDRGADVNQKETKYGLTPLHMAAWKGHTESVRVLLDHGADLNAREVDNETPLFYAAASGSVESVALLLSRGADLKDDKSRVKNSVLWLAVERNQYAVARFLVEKGADVKYQKDPGFTMLHEAGWRGGADMIGLLVDAGLSPNAMNEDDGWTPLMVTVAGGNMEGAKALLKRGANPNLRGEKRELPLVMAVKTGQKDMALLLIASGSSVDWANKEGRTPLHFAAINGYGEVVSALLAKGAPAQAKDSSGKTALDYALFYGQATSAGLLPMAAGLPPKAAVERLSPLKAPARTGKAVVTYLGNSGWAVRTRDHLLIFDYNRAGAACDEPSMANGRVVPHEIEGLKTIAFISHAHRDHYSPEVFEWKKAQPGLTVVTGFDPPDKAGYVKMAPRTSQAFGDVEVTAIEANDGGLGFYVKVDGVSLLHSGDHANRKKDFSEPFKGEIDFLAEKGLGPDMLFAPVSGCGFGDIEAVRAGVYYTVEKLSPRVLFPMHAGFSETACALFAGEAAKAKLEVPIDAPQFPGDSFAVAADGKRAKSQARQETANPRDPVAVFEHVWKTIDRNYGQFGVKHVDWDALYRVYRPQVTQATTDKELWDILLAMLGSLNDEHVCLADGSRRICAGSSEGRKRDEFSLALVKSKYLQEKSTDLLGGKWVSGWLAEGVGYLYCGDFKDGLEPTTKAIDEVLNGFSKARVMVVDVRNNPGGTGRAMDVVAGRFADRRRHFMTTQTRYGPKHDDLWPPEYRNVEPGGPLQFTRPTVLLANRASASGADAFVLAMRVLPHVTVAGDVTEGALSAQFPEKLPNGWTLWVAFKMIRDQDGVCWDGVGVPPDLRVCNTAEDAAAGRDRVLEFAVQFLEKGLPAPQDEADSLKDLKTSMVQEYVRVASDRGADAAIAQLNKSLADKGGAYFFGPDEAIQTAGLYIRRKQFPEALGLLQVFREEYPKVAEGYVMLAEALLGIGDVAPAESALKDGERLEAMFPWEKQQFDQARLALRKAKQGSAADVFGKTLAGSGIPAGEAALKDLMARRPDGPVFDEDDFNALGYRFFQENKVELALFVMEKTVELYPASWNAWDSLGEVSAKAGKKERAIECYRKSLELNPKNKNGKAMLEQLEKG